MLKQLQQDFYRDAVQLREVKNYLDSGHFNGRDLINIYHNQYFSSLSEALAKTYSCIKRLVGEDFFNAVAREFIKTHPLKTGSIITYGSGFADFLASHSHCQAMPYLSDVASFERYYEQCYFLLQDNIFFKSDYPVIKIWQLDENSEQLDLTSGGDYLKIYRQGTEVLVEKITQQQYGEG